MQNISEGGYIETTIGEINTNRAFGLSSTPPDANYNPNGIKYGYNLSSSGLLSIIEFGTVKMNLGTYKTGEVLRIAVENNKVNYYRHSYGLVYTSTLVPALPMKADICLQNTGATLKNVKVQQSSKLVVFQANPVNGGNNPVYQWFVNNTPVGTNSPVYQAYGLSINDGVRVLLSSDALWDHNSNMHEQGSRI